VVGGTFGFQELIRKIGVERRLYTAGEHKAMLDPFLPENPDDVARLKSLQREIHAIFIALVRGSRGAKLKGDEDVLFSGQYWAGETSIALGLSDAIGDLRSVLRARYGDKVEMPVIAPPAGMLSNLLGRKSAGSGSQLALDGLAELPERLISALETRAIWSKYGF
jgi:ClpP class serine protease